jgi:hypothetical protein
MIRACFSTGFTIRLMFSILRNSFPDKDFGCVIGRGWPTKKAYPLPAAFPKSLSEKLYI